MSNNDATEGPDGTPREKRGRRSTARKATARKTPSRKTTARKRTSRKTTARKTTTAERSDRKVGATRARRTREARPYPAAPFEESLVLAEAIQRFASGERVRRLTLLKQMDKSPNSGPTKMMITNSGKYGLTSGSYAAEWLSLTDLGKIASSPDEDRRSKLQAQFKLAVEGIAPFNALYEEYKNKKLPSHDVLKDVLKDANVPEGHITECVDTFIVNAKFLGLLQTIAGSEMLVPIEQVLDEQPAQPPLRPPVAATTASSLVASEDVTPKAKWSKICFYISPIGDEGTEIREHSDLFLNSIVEPALKEFGLEVVRADQIGQGGMITSQILEHVMRSRLAIVDLSWHNPNAFYEMAIRHACKMPIIQICRRADKLPFDVNQVRTVVIDTTNIYTLTPRIETYRSEISSQVRAALNDATANSNPLTVFFPGFEVTIPKEK